MTAGSVVVPVLVLAGILGLVIGSFLNVVIYRVPAGIPLTRESRCPRCEAPVKPQQNVPVISWIALRGKCASCGAPISVRYPLVELGTALAFVAVEWFALASASTISATAVQGWALGVLIVAYLYFAAISIA